MVYGGMVKSERYYGVGDTYTEIPNEKLATWVQSLSEK